MLAILISAQTMWQDLKYGLRQLWSNPGFASVAVLTLALGIGVNTSIFSLLNVLMLRPLAVPDSGGVLAVYRGEDRPCSYPDFVDFQERVGAFSGLAADVTTESALDIKGTNEVILAEAVSYNYATVLEVQAVLGRWFTAEDERAADQFATRQRTREFGIRLALGARRNDVLRLVTGDALTITLAGVVLGLVVSLAFTHLLRGFLYG